MKTIDDSNYVIGKNGVEYEELSALHEIQDKTDRLLTRREYKMLMVIYDMAAKRIIKELAKELIPVSDYIAIKTALGLCGCKHCYEKAKKTARISNGLVKIEKHFLICDKHALEIKNGNHVD